MFPDRVTNATRGFEHVSRYWDGAMRSTIAKIMPGEFYVSEGQDIIATVLGSCVSACVRDKGRPFGAMNHFMLPSSGDQPSTGVDAPHRYGVYAMEAMLNELFKAGTRRRDLEIKIVGGGMILNSSANIGARNIAFVREFLANEGIAITAEDVGTSNARKVLYDVATGRMLVKHMSTEEENDVARVETSYESELSNTPTDAGGDIELF